MDDQESSSGDSSKVKNSDSSDSVNAWDDFGQGIQQVYDKQRLSKIRYLQLYTQVHNYCSNLQAAGPRPPGGGIGTKFKGCELYGRIKDFLSLYVTKLENNGKDLSDHEILQYYCTRWDDYRFSSSVLNSVCDYLNRHWIWREREEGRKHIVEVDQLALVVWKKVMSRSIDKRIINAVMKLIAIERNGGTINTGIISAIINSYVVLGLRYDKDDPRHKGQNLSVYKEAFETPFLEETKIFYTRESAKIFDQHSITEYLIKVEMRLQEEQKRVQTYLHESCLEPLLKICDEVLIASRLEILLAEFKTMLIEERHEELVLVYKLVSRIPEGVGKFHTAFEIDAQNRGLSAIEKCGNEAVNDPKLYVDTILRAYQERASMVLKVFNDDPGFVKALDKACEQFVNHNFVTKMVDMSSAKTPELVARYCDSLLKKSATNLDAAELEETLSQIMIVFKFIEDKDIFQKVYSRMLAKRLVNQSSTSDDAEESIISKMKQSCGMEYTAKLQRMFNDIALSKNLNEKFKSQLTDNSKSLDLDFGVQVLTSGSWPYQQSFTLSLPIELEKSIQEFTTFYNTQFNGRKLNWLYQLCRGELVVNCFEKRYTLQVSTFQMAVLLLFNSSDQYTLQQMEEITQLKYEYLIQIIQLLLKSKLLVCDVHEEDIQPNTVIKLFLEYKNKKQRINLNVPLKLETNAEHDVSRKFVEQERKFLIQAAIVRIMKARKQSQHQQLLSEIFVQLSPLFKPKVVDIKKCIDILVEKEYLERVIGEKDVYRYMA